MELNLEFFYFCHSAVTTSVTASLKYFRDNCLLLFLNVFFLSLLRLAIRLDEVPELPVGSRLATASSGKRCLVAVFQLPFSSDMDYFGFPH